jgi:hypothetical protein
VLLCCVLLCCVLLLCVVVCMVCVCVCVCVVVVVYCVLLWWCCWCCCGVVVVVLLVVLWCHHEQKIVMITVEEFRSQFGFCNESGMFSVAFHPTLRCKNSFDACLITRNFITQRLPYHYILTILLLYCFPTLLPWLSI